MEGGRDGGREVYLHVLLVSWCVVLGAHHGLRQGPRPPWWGIANKLRLRLGMRPTQPHGGRQPTTHQRTTTTHATSARTTHGTHPTDHPCRRRHRNQRPPRRHTNAASPNAKPRPATAPTARPHRSHQTRPRTRPNTQTQHTQHQLTITQRHV